MRGIITEVDCEAIDQCFPGIMRYYRELKDKPKTFLELLWRYMERRSGATVAAPEATESATQ
jgi:hypothetical protein